MFKVLYHSFKGGAHIYTSFIDTSGFHILTKCVWALPSIVAMVVQTRWCNEIIVNFNLETFNDIWWCMYQWHRCRVGLRSSLQGRHRRDHSSSLWGCQNRSQLNNRCRSQQQHMILGERQSFISTAILHMEIKQKKSCCSLLINSYNLAIYKYMQKKHT